jgi:hypothetical protein
MMSGSNIHFEMAERDRAINYGGIGAIHLMGQRLVRLEPDCLCEVADRLLSYSFFS